MMDETEATMLELTGGIGLKQRVQHPKVHERRGYWFIRYWYEEPLPNGLTRTTRKFRTIGPSRGEEAISKKQACVKRDLFLADLNSAPTRLETATGANVAVDPRAIIFGKLAERWRKDYVDNPKVKLATPTREKY